MTSTPQKGYAEPATGTDVGTWGVVLNQNFAIIDNNLGGTLTLSVAGNSNVNLTASQAQNLIYNFTGILTGNINVIFPAGGGLYFINNQTTGAYTLTIQAGASVNGILIPQNTQVPVYVDNSTSPPTVGGAAGTLYNFIASAVGGSANAITVTATTPPNFALNPGVFVSITPTASNTGSTTLNVNGTGVIEVLKVGATGLVAVQAGDIFEDIPALFQYNGTNWVDVDAIYFGNTPTPVSSGFALSFSNWNEPIIATAPLTITVPQVSANFTYFFQTQASAGGGAITWTPYSTDVIWVNGVALVAGASYVQPMGANVNFYTDANGNIFLLVNNPNLSSLYTSAQYAYTAASGTNTTQVATTAFVTAAIATAIGNVPTAISGFLPTSISGSNTTAAIQISAGLATDSTNSIVLSRGINGWAASNGNAINGYDGGTTLPNSSTIHIFSANGTSGTGSFGSTSLTPTFPTGYTTYHRRIFSFNTNGSGAPIPYTAIETEGGAMLAWLATQILDESTNSLGTSRIAFTPTVPTGIKVQVIGRSYSNSTGTYILTSGDETDVAPTGTTGFSSAPGNDSYNNATWQAGGLNGSILTTNTSGQIGVRGSTGSMNYEWVTRGFKDWRRN